MKIKQLHSTTEHRPWELPKEDWKYYQEWNEAIFLHWPVPIEHLRNFVPKELIVDTLNGQAWVSLVAFTMEKVRLKYLPAFPPLSNFDEINIRTYIKNGKRSGVYFLNIEGGKRLSCRMAKQLSQLPYKYSETTRSTGFYQAKSNIYPDLLEIKYEVKQQQIAKDPLDQWLTERYMLYQDYDDYINEYEIHHIEWPLVGIALESLKVNYKRFEKLMHGYPARIHYSPGVQVIAWDKKRKLKTEYSNTFINI